MMRMADFACHACGGGFEALMRTTGEIPACRICGTQIVGGGGPTRDSARIVGGAGGRRGGCRGGSRHAESEGSSQGDGDGDASPQSYLVKQAIDHDEVLPCDSRNGGRVPTRGDARPPPLPPTRGVQPESPSWPTASTAAVVDDRHARSVPFIADSGRLDEAHDPLPVPPPRLQQFHHSVVVDAFSD